MAETARRLFLGLWPDAGVREQLARLAARTVERPVRAGNLHLTLVFLGASNPRQYDCIRAAAAGVCGEPFELRLDYLGGFRRPRIQWLGCQQIPPAIHDLVRSLQALLPACGYTPERRRFVPHVTLARKVKQPRFQLIETPIYWQVEEFALLESVPTPDGVMYRPLQKWGLGNAPGCV